MNVEGHRDRSERPVSQPNGAVASTESGPRLTRADFLRGALAASALPTAAGLLAACGSSSKTASSTTSASVSLRGQTINLLVIQPHAVAAQAMKQDFAAQFGGHLNLTIVPYEQILQKAQLDVLSGANQFDVFDFWYVGVGQLAHSGVLTDMTDYIAAHAAEIDPADFLKSIYDGYTLYNGRRWALPFDGDLHLLFYNTAIFERHHLDPPATWDAYLAAVEKITTDEKGKVYGAAMLGEPSPLIICSTFANRLGGYGGVFLRGNTPALEEPAALEAARAMLAAAPWCLPTPSETGFNQALPAFLNGKVAMMEFWTDLAVYSQDSKMSHIVNQWGVRQLPVGGSNHQFVAPRDAGFSMGVSSHAPHKEAALEFVKWATDKPEHERLITTVGSGIDPTRFSDIASPKYHVVSRAYRAVLAASNHALFWPTGPSAVTLMQKLTDELSLMLAKSKSPEQAMHDAQSAWTQVLSQA